MVSTGGLSAVQICFRKPKLSSGTPPISEARQQEPAYHILDRDSIVAGYFGHQACMEVHSVHYFLPSNLTHF